MLNVGCGGSNFHDFMDYKTGDLIKLYHFIGIPCIDNLLNCLV